MKNQSKPILVALILLICIGIGVVFVVNRNHPQPPPSQPPAPPVAHNEPATEPVQVYRIAVENHQPKLKPVTVNAKVGKNSKETTLRALIEEGDSGKLVNPIPRGTRLLGLRIKSGLAVVDLSREFSDNFDGGSDAEALTISSILRTLAQFPGIQRVQFLVEGKTISTLEHLDLSGPLDVNWTGSENGGEN